MNMAATAFRLRVSRVHSLSIYQPYIDGVKEIREIDADYTAPFVRG